MADEGEAAARKRAREDAEAGAEAGGGGGEEEEEEDEAAGEGEAKGDDGSAGERESANGEQPPKKRRKASEDEEDEEEEEEEEARRRRKQRKQRAREGKAKAKAKAKVVRSQFVEDTVQDEDMEEEELAREEAAYDAERAAEEEEEESEGEEEEEEESDGGGARAAVDAEDDALHREKERQDDAKAMEELRLRTEQRFGRAAVAASEEEAAEAGEAYESYARELAREEEEEAERDAAGGIGGVGGGGGGGGGSQVAKLMPDRSDPRLFLVRCDPGKEPLALLRLLERFAAKRGTNEQLFISSAFTTPASKGYIYVEAPREVHVVKAVTGVPHLRAWSVRVVREEEMAQAATVARAADEVRRGQWVRLKRGLYKGDLALVVDVVEQGTLALVKLVPRVDMLEVKEAAQRAREESENPDDARQRHRALPFGRSRTGQRPLSRLLSTAELQELGAPVSRTRGRQALRGFGRFQHVMFGVFKGGAYRNGFLYKGVPSHGLQTSDVAATPTEVERFRARLQGAGEGGGDEEDADELADLEPPLPETDDPGAARGARRDALVRGSTVRVAKGDMRNLMARVVAVIGDTVRVMPLHKDLNEEMEFASEELEPAVDVGDQVRVVAGPLKDETGLVLRIDKAAGRLVFLSDVSGKEADVDLALAAQHLATGTAPTQLGQYELYDLVQLGQDVVGVVVRIDPAALIVLTQRGQTVAARLQDVTQKRHSRYASALDAAQNVVRVGDIVRSVEGARRGRSGTVRHIFRSYLFLHSRDQVEDGGMWVALARQCVLAGQTRPLSALQMQGAGRGFAGAGPVPASPFSLARAAAAPHPDAAPAFGGGAGRGALRRGAGAGMARDPLMGQQVLIRAGKHKGFRGHVRGVTDTAYRVQLMATPQTVEVPKNAVVLRAAGDEAAGGGMALYAQTPLLGSQTPAWAGFGEGGGGGGGGGGLPFGARTPSWGPAGSRTPALGSQTPMVHYGGSDDSGRGPHSPTYNPEPPTPAPPQSAVASAATPATPRTAGFHAPATPGAPTPFGGAPATPFEPQTPGGAAVATPAAPPVTPAGPAAHGGEGEAQQPQWADPGWCVPGLVVSYNQQEAVVRGVTGGRVRVELNGLEELVAPGNLRPVPARERDLGVLVFGSHRGRRGVVMGVDPRTEERVLKLDDGELVFGERSAVGRLAPERRAAAP